MDAPEAISAAATFPVRAVMVDLDGTLLDTAEDLAAAANAMLAEYGRAPLELAAVRSYIGRGIANLVRRCFGDAASAELPADAVDCFRRHYRITNGRQARIYPGVVEGLRAMHGLGLPLACVTNKASDFALPLLETTGLARWFALKVCGDTLAKIKPDPLPLLHICERFGVAPGEALLIGDSLNDVRAARAAGCPVVCVPYGYNEGAAVRAQDCDAIVPSLEAAARLLLPVPAPAIRDATLMSL